MEYQPTNPNENETNNLVYSTEIPLTGLVGSDTTLTTDLGFALPLPATVAVIVAIGIIFYQDINGVLYGIVLITSILKEAKISFLYWKLVCGKAVKHVLAAFLHFRNLS